MEYTWEKYTLPPGFLRPHFYYAPLFLLIIFCSDTQAQIEDHHHVVQHCCSHALELPWPNKLFWRPLPVRADWKWRISTSFLWLLWQMLWWCNIHLENPETLVGIFQRRRMPSGSGDIPQLGKERRNLVTRVKRAHVECTLKTEGHYYTSGTCWRTQRTLAITTRVMANASRQQIYRMP